MAQGPKREKITPQLEIFCQEYVATSNASEAARRAGFSAANCHTIAHKVLHRPEIKARINEIKQGFMDKIGVNTERVLQEIARVAFSDLRKVAKWDGKKFELVDINDIDDDAAASLQAISFSESSSSNQHGGSDSFSLSVKMHDKMKALDMLGRHLKLFTDQLEVKTTSDLAERLARAKQRLKK